MNIFQIALNSIKRKPGKSITLFITLFILSSLLMGSFSIRQAVINTEASLFNQIPAVATITMDLQALMEAHSSGESAVQERITSEVIENIGDLSYVNTFDMSLEGFIFSRFLNRSNHLSFTPSIPIVDSHAVGTRGDGSVEMFRFLGVHSSDLAHESLGLISIFEGGSFTQEQLGSGAPVAIISRQLAVKNNLQVGSILNMENNIYQGLFREEFLQSSEQIDLTVIGIFDNNSDFFDVESNEDSAGWREIQMVNRIYIPLLTAENLMVSLLEREAGVHSLSADTSIEDSLFLSALFILNDPRQFGAFAEAAQTYLPDFWKVDDVASHTIGDFIGAMEQMLWIADLVFYTSIGATLIIVILLIFLFLRERKEEIGIYLALGKKKWKITMQFLIEVQIIAFIAIGLSALTGKLYSSFLSSQLLEQELVNQEEINLFSDFPFELNMFYTGQMTHEEIIYAVDISMPMGVLAIFFAVLLITVSIATVVPVLYAITQQPKKVLM